MPEYKIEKKKIIFSADLNPNIDFFSKQYDLLKKYIRDFPNWELSGLIFTIQDRENHCSSTITDKKIIFEIEDANNKIDFTKTRINNILKEYNEMFPIENINRAGIRFFIFVPMYEIKKEELADIIQSKLYVNNKELHDIFSEKLYDLAYIRDYTKDDFLYHFKCGPMPTEQIPAWVNFGQNRHKFKTTADFKDYLDSFPKISIFIDIDCYKNNITFSDFDKFLSKSFENSLKTATKIKDYILGV